VCMSNGSFDGLPQDLLKVLELGAEERREL